MIRGFFLLGIAGLAGAALVRVAPGFGIEEQALDIRLSPESQKALQARHSAEKNLLEFVLYFAADLLRGNAGTSTVFSQPVSQLIAERAPRTLRSVAAGLLLGWTLALLLGWAAGFHGGGLTVLPGVGLTGLLLSTPSAVVATVCLLLNLSPAFAIAAVIFPRVFPHAHAQFRIAARAAHVTLARARGIAGVRLMAFYVFPAAIPPLVALAGTSITLAFGASIPIEALADSPGLGQAAWRAALGRDLTLLVSATLLLTAVTIAANTIADLALLRVERGTR